MAHAAFRVHGHSWWHTHHKLLFLNNEYNEYNCSSVPSLVLSILTYHRRCQRREKQRNNRRRIRDRAGQNAFWQWCKPIQPLWQGEISSRAISHPWPFFFFLQNSYYFWKLQNLSFFLPSICNSFLVSMKSIQHLDHDFQQWKGCQTSVKYDYNMA